MHGPQTVEDQAVDIAAAFDRVDIRDSREHLAQQMFQLDNGEAGAQTDMLAGSEGKMLACVEWSSENTLFQAKASAEVILAAGAINTPQLLQLSGIGAAGLLGGLGIRVIHDAPDVGE